MKRILLIDDDKKSARLLDSELKFTHNFDVKWITSAADVMDAVNGRKYDAIILDIAMPIPEGWNSDEICRAELGRFTGIILFEKIRKVYKDIPILIYTEQRDTVVTDDFSFVLHKPALIKEVVSKLNELIEKEKQSIESTKIHCPVCKSTDISDASTYKSNGILGPGCASWKTSDLRSCNQCGVVFKPVKGNGL